ncbi:MAG: DUF2341 domain-containing protein, partial [Candidatus Peribacteraceae bacterium]
MVDFSIFQQAVSAAVISAALFGQPMMQTIRGAMGWVRQDTGQVTSRLDSADFSRTDWPYRKSITVNHAHVDSDLLGFPLLVQIQADPDMGRRTMPSGHDIRFTDERANVLPHEREAWTVANGSGSGIFWVKVPRISSSTGALLYMHYGNPAAADGATAADAALRVRDIGDTAHSDAWTTFEYRNIHASGNTITIGAENDRIRAAEWGGYRRIVIDHADVDADRKDVPIPVRINQDAGVASMRSDGADIRFTTSTGAVIPHERERWHVGAGSGSGIFWVRVPKVLSSTGTVLYMYYGNPDATDDRRSEDGEDILHAAAMLQEEHRRALPRAPALAVSSRVKRITELPAGSDVILADETGVNVEDVPQAGVRPVRLRHHVQPLAEFAYDFDEGTGDLSGVVAEHDPENARAVVHGLAAVPGVQGTYTMYIKKKAEHSRVRICAGKETPGCTRSDNWSFLANDEGQIIETNGSFDVTGITVWVEGGYWKIAGLRETGGEGEPGPASSSSSSAAEPSPQVWLNKSYTTPSATATRRLTPVAPGTRAWEISTSEG